MGPALLTIALTTALPVGAATPVADGQGYVDARGVAWNVAPNRHGAVLRSGGDKLYLGRSCDARSARFGKGRWGWANGGVLVTFRGRTIGFPRQDPPIAGARCGL